MTHTRFPCNTLWLWFNVSFLIQEFLQTSSQRIASWYLPLNSQSHLCNKVSLSPQLPRHPSCLDTTLSEVSFKWLLVLAADQCQGERIFLASLLYIDCKIPVSLDYIICLSKSPSLWNLVSLCSCFYTSLSLPSHTFWSVFISLSSVFIHLYLYLSLSQFSPFVSMYLQLYLPAYLFMSISFYLQYLPTYLLIMLSLGVLCVYVCVYDLGSQMSRYRVCFLGCLCLKSRLHTLCCIHFALDAEHSPTCCCALRKRHFSILMVCILKKIPLLVWLETSVPLWRFLPQRIIGLNGLNYFLEASAVGCLSSIFNPNFLLV